MRPRSLLVLLMIASTAAGCMHARAPQVAGTPQPAHAVPPAPQNLDAMAYERNVPAAQSYAHARVPPRQGRAGAQGGTQAKPQSEAEMLAQIHLEAHGPAAMATPVAAPMVATGPMVAPQAVAAPVAVAVPPGPEPAYALDIGDKLRIVVFGQDGLSNSYFVDAAGQVTMPLIGPVRARGLTTQQLSRAISGRLRAGFIREPHVAIEVEVYRPFFILGEVLQPGQYPYVPSMTVETAVAIAGGYTPRAYRWDVQIDRPEASGMRSRSSVPLMTKVRPGDTIVIKERWF
jgi:polysaccharide export outer membrane protein